METDVVTLLGLAEPVRRFVEDAELLIACAVPDGHPAEPSLIDEVTRRGVTTASLRSTVRAAAKEPDDVWTVPLLALLAVRNRWLAFDELTVGSVHRRIDAVFDLFETGFCAHEVQTLFLDEVGLVHGVAARPAEAAIAASGAARTSGATGVGGELVAATEQLLNDAHPVTAAQVLVAQFRLLRGLLERDPRFSPLALAGLEHNARQQLAGAAAELLTSPIEAGPVWDHRAWAHVVGEATDPGAPGDPCPDVNDLTLEWAAALMARREQGVVWVDVADRPGALRRPVEDHTWRVVAQWPPRGAIPIAGSEVAVGVVRHGESPVGEVADVLQARLTARV